MNEPEITLPQRLTQFVSAEFTACELTIQQMLAAGVDSIVSLAQLLIERYLAGNKLLIIGNGGSAAEAQHFAAELVGHYKLERGPLPAIALTTDTSALTAIGNDYSFEHIFARQVEALATKGDVVLAMSTSGRSANVIAGLRTARDRGAYTAALVGQDASQLVAVADLIVCVPSNLTPRVQEIHAIIVHILCDLLEQAVSQPFTQSVNPSKG